MKLLIINNMHSNSNAWVKRTVLLLRENGKIDQPFGSVQQLLPFPQPVRPSKVFGKSKVCFCTDNIVAQRISCLQNGYTNTKESNSVLFFR